MTILSRCIDDSRVNAPLTREEEVLLGRRIAGGMPDARDAVDRLVLAHLRLVIWIASRYRHLSVSQEDLISEGMIGLMIAAERFDPERGTRFLTYAAWWIRKTIFKALHESSSLVRIPEYQRDRMNRARALLEGGETAGGARCDPGRPPGLPNVVVSLEGDAAMPGRTIADTLRQPDVRSPEEVLLHSELAAALKSALTCLDPREHRVLESRYGLAGDAPQSLAQVGAMMGVSRERVRQLEKQACHKLRNRIDARPLRRPGSMPDRGGESRIARGEGAPAGADRAQALPVHTNDETDAAEAMRPLPRNPRRDRDLTRLPVQGRTGDGFRTRRSTRVTAPSYPRPALASCAADP